MAFSMTKKKLISWDTVITIIFHLQLKFSKHEASGEWLMCKTLYTNELKLTSAIDKNRLPSDVLPNI
jgi:hypothetical protein